VGFSARPVYELVFAEDTGLEGLEVSARGADVATYLEILQADDLPAVEQIPQRLKLIAPLLVSWNLEDDAGSPVPTTWEGMQGVDQRLLGQIIEAWLRMVAGVPGPLGRRSTSGGPPPTLPDVDLPMESPSLPS